MGEKDIEEEMIASTQCPSKKTIAAGIVTFNPDIKRLSDNLSAISPQVETVFIYDNASENIRQLTNLLNTKFPKAVLSKSSVNGGMAVALNSLAHTALNRGFSHILLLDQDSVAEEKLVEKLMGSVSPDVGIVSPRIIDRNEREYDTRETGVVRVSRAITSGAILNLRAFEVVGGYDERLFVDWVDFEFSDNLRTHGYGIVRVNDAVLLHELGKEEYAGVIPRRTSDGSLEMRPYYRTNHAIWRRRDKARSQAITIEKYKNTPIAVEEWAIFLKGLLKTLLFERSRIKTLKATVSGWREGRDIVSGRDLP